MPEWSDMQSSPCTNCTWVVGTLVQTFSRWSPANCVDCFLIYNRFRSKYLVSRLVFFIAIYLKSPAIITRASLSNLDSKSFKCEFSNLFLFLAISVLFGACKHRTSALEHRHIYWLSIKGSICKLLHYRESWGTLSPIKLYRTTSTATGSLMSLSPLEHHLLLTLGL